MDRELLKELNRRQSWITLCRYRCRLLLAEVPKGLQRNAEVKRRLQLWEAGEVHDLIGRILGNTLGNNTGEKNTTRPQTKEHRGDRVCAFTAKRSISKAVKGLVGGGATGTAEHRIHWTTALFPRSSGRGTHSTGAQAARAAWGAGRYKEARNAMREQGRSKTGIALLHHVKLAPMSTPGTLM